ncbi:hypothetical protein PIB30_044922 [Stylosanthes scabra]|uniref:Uncharacterized protein n=1 Tax=Stylosanthes scabra TaxID=79078 RepID=A0ABU6YDD1_9FABA|nr:hypothetical protein [Stylosanthes scabra]
MLGEIFNSSTAIGKLSHVLTREPPNSDEEKQMEDDFIVKGVHISDSIDIDSDEHVQRSDEKRKQNGYPKLLKAEVEKYKAQERDPNAIYNNTLVKFKDSDLRRMFVKMSSSRRKEWLISCE